MMKRMLALLTGALLALLPAASLAESILDLPLPNPIPEPTPEIVAPPVSGESGDSIALEIDGRTVRLNYDSSPLYSSLEGGLVQACFYGYAEDGVTLYELYVIFPATARAGMVISPEYMAMTGGESSIVLIESNNQQERYFVAGLMDSKAYPAGSNFSIDIQSVEEAPGGTFYAGTLSATLVAMNMATGETEATLSIDAIPFRFTLEAAVSEQTGEPAPTATPSDMRKV